MSTEGMEQESVTGFDPWGLKRIEKLLVELDGVGSLKLVPDGHGGIDEVHVLTSSSLSPKQIVRNIESALLAEFGMQIDHRKISIARTRTPEISQAEAAESDVPEIAPEAPAEPEIVRPPRTVLNDVRMERRAGREFSCRVELLRADEKYVGEAEGPDFERSRMEVAAVAALEALQDSASGDVHLSLQGVSLLPSLGRSFVVTLIGASEGRTAETLSGICSVTDSVEEAAVYACLMATNRWLEER